MLTHETSALRAIWNELRQRKVFKVALVYVLMAWGVMQVGELMFEALQVPDGAYSLLVILVLLGFPVAVVLAWAYEITPGGVRRDVVRELQQGTPEKKPVRQDVRPRICCIAILPFRDMTREQDEAHFCEGLAEEIQNALCKVERLEVVARAHSVQFGGKKIDVREIARKLGASSVLEGSVRKANGELRISVQLVNTSNGTDIWSKSFQVPRDDEFRVQQDVANTVSEFVKLTFRSRHGLHCFKCDPLCFDYYRRGMRFFRRRTARDIHYARRMFDSATRVDGEFGPAWAGLACSDGFEFLHFNRVSRLRERGERCAETALEWAPDLATSYIARGFVHLMGKNSTAANEAFETAAAIDTQSFDARYFNAFNWSRSGQPARAANLYDQAAQRRGKDFQAVYERSRMLNLAGDVHTGGQVLEQALEMIRIRLEYRPDDFRAMNIGALALMDAGEQDTAVEWMEDSLDQSPVDAVLEYNAACLYSQAGDISRCLDHLRKCKILGEPDRDWLQRDPRLMAMRTHPEFPMGLATGQITVAIPSSPRLSAGGGDHRV